MKKIFLIIFMMITSIISFSSNTHNKLSEMARSKKYHLVELSGIDLVSIDASVRNDLTLKIKDNRVYGFTGLNAFTGDLGNESLLFEKIAVTKVAGPENLMKLEDHLLYILSESEHYVVNGNKLTFHSKSGKMRAVYEVINDMNNMTKLEDILNDSIYTLKSFSKVKVSTLSKIDRNKLTITSKDGRVSGYAGVNNFFGSYNENGFLDKIGTTRKAGSVSSMNFEKEYIKALSTIKKIEMIGRELKLTTDNGILIYRK